MHKKILAMLLAGSMVMSSSAIVMAAESEAASEAVVSEETASEEAAGEEADAEVVGDDDEIKAALEGLLDEVTGEDGSFDADELEELMGSLFGPEEGEETHDFEPDSEEGLDFFNQIDEAINQHLADETADELEAGDETLYTRTIADLDFDEENDNLYMLGYFSVTNFVADEESPADLAMLNYIGQPELLTFAANEDGVYEVVDYVVAEEGEGNADSVAAMCDEIDMDVNEFYEAMALNDLVYIAYLYDFMETHPEYEHIEYTGEMKTLDDLQADLEDEFSSYLALYELDDSLTDAAEDEEYTEESDSFDFRGLVDASIAEIEEAVANVDLKAKAENIGKAFSEAGTVFSLVEDILSDIDTRKSEDGAEKDEAVTEALEALSTIEETDEETLDDLLTSALLGVIAGAVDEDLDEGNKPEDIDVAITIANFVFDTVKENEQIAAAVEATDSILFEKFDKSIEKLESHAAGNGAVNGDEVPEEPFEEYEEEFAEVEDYINEQGAPKQAALDILNLAHSIVDEIHFMVHGHTAAEVE